MAMIYTTKVKVNGGRAGRAISDDGRLDIQLVPPKEASPDRPGVNPEQLFAAGYAACFESSMRAAARRANISLLDASIEATVSLVSCEVGGYALEVTLNVETQGISQSEADTLADQAHRQVCPYSNAIRGNIDVQLQVTAH